MKDKRECLSKIFLICKNILRKSKVELPHTLISVTLSVIFGRHPTRKSKSWGLVKQVFIILGQKPPSSFPPQIGTPPHYLNAYIQFCCSNQQLRFWRSLFKYTCDYVYVLFFYALDLLYAQQCYGYLHSWQRAFSLALNQDCKFYYLVHHIL